MQQQASQARRSLLCRPFSSFRLNARPAAIAELAAHELALHFTVDICRFLKDLLLLLCQPAARAPIKNSGCRWCRVSAWSSTPTTTPGYIRNSTYAWGMAENQLICAMFINKKQAATVAVTLRQVWAYFWNHHQGKILSQSQGQRQSQSQSQSNHRPTLAHWLWATWRMGWFRSHARTTSHGSAFVGARTLGNPPKM